MYIAFLGILGQINVIYFCINTFWLISKSDCPDNIKTNVIPFHFHLKNV